MYLYFKPQLPIARIVVSACLVYNGQHVCGGGKVVVLMLPTVNLWEGQEDHESGRDGERA